MDLPRTCRLPAASFVGQYTYYVTFGSWVEVHDRRLAQRSSRERRERQEAARQEILRRQRASAEFQVKETELDGHLGHPPGMVRHMAPRYRPRCPCCASIAS